jgi:hypothetical protein
VPSAHNVTRALSHVLAGMLAAGAADAGAQQVENSLRDALHACAALAKDSERLACYDRTTERLFSGIPVESKRSSPEEMFGAGRRPPRDSRAEGQVAPEPLSRITAHVAVLREGKDGSILIELDNGQVWRQSGAGELLLRAGDHVTISRAALGTFRLATPTGRFAQVRRVR